MRSIALDIHRDFCEVAIKDGAEVRSAGRIKTSAEELELFAQSLAPDDQVALEATGPALQIKRLIEPHVGRVIDGDALSKDAAALIVGDQQVKGRSTPSYRVWKGVSSEESVHRFAVCCATCTRRRSFKRVGHCRWRTGAQ